LRFGRGVCPPRESLVEELIAIIDLPSSALVWFLFPFGKTSFLIFNFHFLTSFSFNLADKSTYQLSLEEGFRENGK
jgi:hypothetical protein